MLSFQLLEISLWLHRCNQFVRNHTLYGEDKSWPRRQSQRFHRKSPMWITWWPRRLGTGRRSDEGHMCDIGPKQMPIIKIKKMPLKGLATHASPFFLSFSGGTHTSSQYPLWTQRNLYQQSLPRPRNHPSTPTRTIHSHLTLSLPLAQNAPPQKCATTGPSSPSAAIAPSSLAQTATSSSTNCNESTTQPSAPVRASHSKSPDNVYHIGRIR